MSSIMGQIEPEHPELFALEIGKIPENDFVYVLRNVGIGTIPELSCAKSEFLLCPPILELYRTILELHKRNMSYYVQIWSLRKVGIGVDKLRI